jgi:hypothetical protein
MGLPFDRGTINPSPTRNYQEPVTWHAVRSVPPMAPLSLQGDPDLKLLLINQVGISITSDSDSGHTMQF